MSTEHKAALAEGRDQGRAVRAYLEAIETAKPKRGRKRTPESIERRLTAIDETYDSADPMKRLGLAQERLDLEAELATFGTPEVDLDALEQEFVRCAAPFAERKGITYAAFRAVGVAPAVLSAAGVKRGSRSE